MYSSYVDLVLILNALILNNFIIILFVVLYMHIHFLIN